MPFFYDRISGQSGISQYENYLNNELYLYELHRDVKDITNYQLIEVRKAIAKNSAELQRSVYSSVTQICGTLELGLNQITSQLYESNRKLDDISQGIDDINWTLTDINDNLSELRALFDWKTDLMIAQQKMTNSYLATIAVGVHLPESKKLNTYHNDRGDVFLKNAVAEGAPSKFYEDAWHEFNEAYRHDSTDYRCLRQLGFIYLNAKKYLNIEKAEDFFSRSASYALAFYHSKPNSALADLAATSLYYASYCDYLLDKQPEALSLIKRAVEFKPGSLKYRFRFAKLMAAYGREKESAEILLEIILENKWYSIEILKDQDLVTKTAVREMLSQETARLIAIVEEELSKLKELIAGFDDPESVYRLQKIEEQFESKTFLTASMAIEALGIQTAETLYDKIHQKKLQHQAEVKRLAEERRTREAAGKEYERRYNQERNLKIVLGTLSSASTVILVLNIFWISYPYAIVCDYFLVLTVVLSAFYFMKPDEEGSEASLGAITGGLYGALIGFISSGSSDGLVAFVNFILLPIVYGVIGLLCGVLFGLLFKAIVLAVKE